MEGQVRYATEGQVGYARSGDATIAYRVLGGDGPDLLFLGGLLSHVEVVLEEPGLARFFERMTNFARVVLVDRRGSRLSDGLPEGFTLEDEAGVRNRLGGLERAPLSPGALQRIVAYQAELDVGGLLPEINVPSLVLHRTDDRLVDVRHSRYLAENLPGARLVELPGIDNMP